MKLIQTKVLLANGPFSNSPALTKILTDIETAITTVSWPTGSGTFKIRPERKGNGVKPIKNECMTHLEQHGWNLETRLQVASRAKPGPIDATLDVGDGRKFAVEWETGNISSSHRAVNKMAVGMLSKQLVGGVLILPSRKMYKYLTDRIGNFCEIEPYFPMWESLVVEEGFLAVIEIEHNEESDSVPLIPKGTDGWALHQKT